MRFTGPHIDGGIPQSAYGLRPLTPTQARRIIEQTRVCRALKGGGAREPVDLAARERVLVRPGRLAVEQPWIKQMDISPLRGAPERVVASDAWVVEWGSELPEDRRLRPVMCAGCTAV
jgi:acetyltransferase